MSCCGCSTLSSTQHQRLSSHGWGRWHMHRAGSESKAVIRMCSFCKVWARRSRACRDRRQLYASRQVQHRGGRCLVNCRKGMSRSAEASRIFVATFKSLQRDSKVGLTGSKCLRPRRKGIQELPHMHPGSEVSIVLAYLILRQGRGPRRQMQERKRDSGKPRQAPCIALFFSLRACRDLSLRAAWELVKTQRPACGPAAPRGAQGPVAVCDTQWCTPSTARWRFQTRASAGSSCSWNLPNEERSVLS